jgi:hypothetical protein
MTWLSKICWKQEEFMLTRNCAMFTCVSTHLVLTCVWVVIINRKRPQQLSGWFLGLIILVLKKSKNHLGCITTILLNFDQKTNNHLQKRPVLYRFFHENCWFFKRLLKKSEVLWFWFLSKEWNRRLSNVDIVRKPKLMVVSKIKYLPNTGT